MSVGVTERPSARIVTSHATEPRRSVVWALARAEGWRLVRHPVFVVSALISMAIFVLLTWNRAPVLHREAILTSLALLPMAAATLIVTNLAALRSRRHGTQDLLDSVPVPSSARTMGHLISVAWPAGAALLLAGLDMAYLLFLSPAGTPSVLELCTGPAIVALSGVFAIAVARWVPSVVGGPISLVGVVAAQAVVATSTDPDERQKWIGLFGPVPGFDTNSPPPELSIRPTGLHLAYLVGILLVLGAVAMLKHGRSGRRLIAAAVATLLVAVAGGAQLAAPSQAERKHVADLLLHPREHQVCETRGGVEYCAYPEYAPWIEKWAAPIESVLAQVPEHARPESLRVDQVLAFASLHLPMRLQSRLTTERRRLQQRSILTGTDWGRGSSAGDHELNLALATAAAVFGIQRDPFRVPCNLAGDARGLVGMWLAAQASPRAADTLVATRDDYLILFGRGERPAELGFEAPFTGPAWTHLWWGHAEALYAERLLARPRAEVRSIIESRWDVLSTAGTRTDEVLGLFDLEPLPSIDEQIRAAGKHRNELGITKDVPCP